MRCIPPALLTLALAISPNGARAQETTREDEARAVAYYEQGLRAALIEDYAAAITSFKRGHAIKPNGQFTYNIVVAYIKLGDFARAREFARRTHARSRDLHVTLQAKNDARLRALNARATAARQARQIGPDIVSGLLPAQDAPSSVAPTPQVAVTPVAPQEVSQEVSQELHLEAPNQQLDLAARVPDVDTYPARYGRRRRLGGVALGVGLGAGASSIATHLAERHTRREYAREYTPPFQPERAEAGPSVSDCDRLHRKDGTDADASDIQACHDNRSRVGRLNRASQAGLVVGALTGITGVTLLAITPSPRRHQRVSLTPALTRRAGGLEVAIAF